MTDIFKDDLLDGSHAVITGGSSGINYAIARRFAEHGANLTLIARTQEKLDRAAAELEKEFGVSALGLSSDVRDYEQMEEVIGQGRRGIRRDRYLGVWCSRELPGARPPGCPPTASSRSSTSI